MARARSRSRPTWGDLARRPRGLRRDGLQLHGSRRGGVSQGASREAGDRHGDRERRGHARHLHHRSREGLRRFVRSLHHDRPRFGGRLVELLQCAAVAGRRLCVDRLRLSRRALAKSVAEHQLAVRNYRHLRISQGHLLLLPVVVDREAGAALFPHWNWPGMEGKEIAVWVHSNLDRVELLQNGKSLGAKDMKKDSHLAWNVTYPPGALEARGFKAWPAGDGCPARDRWHRGEAGDPD